MGKRGGARVTVVPSINLTARPSPSQFAWACRGICRPLSRVSDLVISSGKR
jgi:hypothetical protein